jgi:hypothetical protein
MDTQTVATYVGLVAVGIAAGAGTGFFAASTSGGQAAGQNVISALEAQSEQDLELLDVKRKQGMFQVDVRTQDDRVQTYYASPDGSLFFGEGSATNTETLTRVANQREKLGNCLQRKQVKMYGNISQRPTQVQIQALGQTNLDGVYSDVNNASALQAAVRQGVNRTPAFVHDGSSLSGINTPSRVAEFTGCSYNVTR